VKGQRDHLEDLLAEINKVALFTQAGRERFLRDERDQYAVMMAYSRIGEILKQIDEGLLTSQPQIDWKSIKGFRDVLIHRYFDIRIELVWQAVEQLPALRAAVEALHASLPPEDEA
jgi:uncharacterized protein with HEPN domain